MWSVRDLDLESMINFSTRVTRFDQTQCSTSSIYRRFSQSIYIMFDSGRTLLHHKGEVQLFFLLFEIKFSNDKTSRIKFSLFYYISFHNNLSNMGSLIICSQQQHDFQEKYYVSYPLVMTEIIFPQVLNCFIKGFSIRFKTESKTCENRVYGPQP